MTQLRYLVKTQYGKLEILFEMSLIWVSSSRTVGKSDEHRTNKRRVNLNGDNGTIGLIIERRLYKNKEEHNKTYRRKTSKGYSKSSVQKIFESRKEQITWM